MIYDVIIIGSGPAGLAAAIYAERARLSAVVLEKEYVSGGQVVNTYEVDNYPGMPGLGGFELGMKLREHAEGLGAKFINIEATDIGLEEDGKIKVVHTRKGEYRARTLILAMGAKKRSLGVPGEKELTGMGVSYCATCDGAFFKGKRVAVVGGGDVAAEDALFLARGCEKVYVIHRRDELRAAASLQERLRECENVEFLWNTEVSGIVGEGQVKELMLQRKRTAVPDGMCGETSEAATAERVAACVAVVGGSDGNMPEEAVIRAAEATGNANGMPEEAAEVRESNRSMEAKGAAHAGEAAGGGRNIPQEAAGGGRGVPGEAAVLAAEVPVAPDAEEQAESLAVDGVFIAVGTVPDTGIITKLLHLDKNGYIVAGEDGITEIPGIFAAGDIRTKELRQIVTAAADGANAVNSVLNYLNTI